MPEVIEPRFHRPTLAITDVAAATDDDKKFGVIDTRGEWVLEPAYACIKQLQRRRICVLLPREFIRLGQLAGLYLNLRGEPVVRGNKHLSERMVCALR